MSNANPHLKHAERSSYELAYLLRELPRHVRFDEPVTADQQLQIEAAHLQALNYGAALLHGIEAIGRVMWAASLNEENQIDASNYGDVGHLITELAAQLQFLGEFTSEIHDHNLRQAQKGKRK